MTPTITPQAFVAKWQQATLRERASSQEHFIDLCRLIGHPTPAEADPAGKWFTFEAGAQRLPSPAAAGEGGELRSQGVRAGWADVWKMGHFAWEYKGQHANLDKAYAQLLQYRESLLNPPLLIVSDMQRIVIHTNFTNTAKQTHNLALEDLLEPARLDLLRQAFTDPDALRPSQTPQQVTEKAAQEFGRLAELLRRYGNDPHATAHFLIRLLFCLYAEDANILPGGLFTRLVTQPATTGVLTGQLRQLFAAMAAGGAFGADVIPHVDGGLFDDDAALDLDSESRRILAEVSRLDWSAIKPSILGTLFERSLDPGKRSQLGAHYTGEEDILLIVEPVLMAPLRRRWGEVKAEAEAKAEKRDLIAGSKPSPQKTRQLAKIEGELFGLLRGFRAELAATQVLDAACGSGNFLYVSLRLLLDLEKEVITLAAALGDSLAIPMVSPKQLHGIEINPYAYELAQTTIWIGYIQWWRDNGFGLPEEPILKPLEAIRQMDAIMAGDRGQETGAGIGTGGQGAGVAGGGCDRRESAVLGREQDSQGVGRRIRGRAVQALRGPRSGVRRPGVLLVREGAGADRGREGEAGWAAGNASRFAAVRIARSWSGSRRLATSSGRSQIGIGFWMAQQYMFRWWVSMTEAKEIASLTARPVIQINPDLTSSVDVTVARRLAENRGICFMGPSPKAPFDIDSRRGPGDAGRSLNINGRPNTDVVRPVASAIDLVQGSRGKWTIDFGLMHRKRPRSYEMPFEYVEETCIPCDAEPTRCLSLSNGGSMLRPRPGMRKALNGLDHGSSLLLTLPNIASSSWIAVGSVCATRHACFRPRRRLLLRRASLPHP